MTTLEAKNHFTKELTEFETWSEFLHSFPDAPAMLFVMDAVIDYFDNQMTQSERFKKPTDQQLVEFAILVNDGELDREKLTGMVAMCEMIIDRLHEHGDVTIKSTIEKELEKD